MTISWRHQPTLLCAAADPWPGYAKPGPSPLLFASKRMPDIGLCVQAKARKKREDNPSASTKSSTQRRGTARCARAHRAARCFPATSARCLPQRPSNAGTMPHHTPLLTPYGCVLAWSADARVCVHVRVRVRVYVSERWLFLAHLPTPCRRPMMNAGPRPCRAQPRVAARR